MLLERESELSFIASAVEDAPATRPSVIAVSGAWGIGRSALLNAVAERTRQPVALVLRATGDGHDLPFSVVRELIGGLPPGAHSPDPDGVGDPGGSESRAVLHRSAGGRPLVLLVDDPHRADRQSLRWLEALANSPGRAVLVVSRCGNAQGPADRLLARADHELSLRPLSRTAIEQLVTRWFGEPGHDGFVRVCASISQGRPLALAELLTRARAKWRKPGLVEARELRGVRLPALAARAVRVLVEETAPNTRELARSLAILDGPADLELLSLLAEVDRADCAEAVTALVAAGLVAKPATPVFAFAGVRDAVEAMMPDAEVAERHLQTAWVLETSGRPSKEVVEHLLAFEVPAPGWAVRRLRSAGLAAWRHGDPYLALRCLRKALGGTPERSHDHTDLLMELAAVERSREPVWSMRRLVDAIPRLASPVRRSRELAAVPTLMFEAAPASLVRELVTADFGGSPQLAVALDTRLRYARIGESAQVMDSVREFSVLGSEPRIRSVAVRERLSVLAYSAALAGQNAAKVAKVACLVLRAEAPSAEDVCTAVPLAARGLLATGSTTQAVSWLATVARLARLRWGDGAAETLLADAEHAVSLARLSKYPEAVTLATQVLDRVDPAFSPVTTRCCEALAFAGMEAASPAMVAVALRRHRDERHASLPRWLGHLVDGVIAAASHEYEGAVAYLLECGRQRELLGWTNPAVLPSRTWAARLQRKLGWVDQANELREQELRLVSEWNSMPGGERVPEDERVVGTGDEPGAGSSEPMTARDLAGLTAAERRVVTLVLEGATNQRIADYLGIGRRTVEKHLTRAYRKLGVSGRAELAGSPRR